LTPFFSVDQGGESVSDVSAVLADHSDSIAALGGRGERVNGVSVQNRMSSATGGLWMVAAGQAGYGEDRSVLQMAGCEAEDAERRERQSDVEKNGMDAPFQTRLPRTLAEYSGGNKLNEFAP
jgi:hypothetical protein